MHAVRRQRDSAIFFTLASTARPVFALAFTATCAAARFTATLRFDRPPLDPAELVTATFESFMVTLGILSQGHVLGDHLHHIGVRLSSQSRVDEGS